MNKLTIFLNRMHRFSNDTMALFFVFLCIAMVCAISILFSFNYITFDLSIEEFKFRAVSQYISSFFLISVAYPFPLIIFICFFVNVFNVKENIKINIYKIYFYAIYIFIILMLTSLFLRAWMGVIILLIPWNLFLVLFLLLYCAFKWYKKIVYFLGKFRYNFILTLIFWIFLLPYIILKYYELFFLKWHEY